MAGFGRLAPGTARDVGIAAVCVLAVLAFHGEVTTDVYHFAGDMVLGFDVHERRGATRVKHFDEAWGCARAGTLAALGLRVAIGAWAGWSGGIIPGGVAGLVLLLVLSL